MNAKISVFVICVEAIIYLLIIWMTVPLNKKASAISSCIQASTLIDLMDIHLPLFTDIINNSLIRGIFSDELKLTEVIRSFKLSDTFKGI